MNEIEGSLFDWKAKATTTTTTFKALSSVNAKSYEQALDAQEALIGDNNLRSVSFLELGLRLSRSVAQIIVPGFGLGTGFMVSHNCILTNHHVVPSVNYGRRALARFNFELDFQGKLLPTYYYNLVPDILFVTDRDLDFSLIAVDKDPGLTWGVIPVTEWSNVGLGERVNIIQHPAGGPKKVAFIDNQIVYSDEIFIQYLTDTLPGSSGSPVFNDDWHLIGLHHSGGWIPEPSSLSTHFRNEGIRISAIMGRLKELNVV